MATLIAIALLHLLAYRAVVLINASRPRAAFVNVSTALDTWIPYLSWTWVFYYFAYFYVIIWAGYLFWRIPAGRTGRLLVAYTGMILIGALIQVALPVLSPWPDAPIALQRWMHDTLPVAPYACLPSMHVALSVLPAALALEVVWSRWLKVTSTVLAAMITISTLTLKEHYVLDAVTGVLLGVAAWAFWRLGEPRARHSRTTAKRAVPEAPRILTSDSPVR